MRISTFVWAGLAVSAACGAAWAQEVAEVSGRIDEVTVYRGQALVTRVVEIGEGGGLREIIVGGLPAAVVPSSLYADAVPGVAVRSIRYRERPVERDVREEVKAIDAQIEEVQREQRAVESRARLLGEERAYLAQLEQFGGQTAVTELRSGVLDAGTIKSLSEFIFAERERLSGAELEQQERARELAARLEQLQRERAQIAGSTARTVREAVMLVDLDGERARELRLRYLVNQATWEPSYTVRTDESHNGVAVEYYAAIQQLSGEDWTDVTMTLSTATASLVAKAPDLEPLRLALSAPVQIASEQAQTLRDDYAERKAQVEQQRQQAGDFEGGGRGRADLDSELNELAANIWLLDATSAGRVVKRESFAEPAPEESQLSVTYAVRERTSMPSRSDRQQVQIAAIPMEAEFYKLAAPALTAQVFDEARITNTSSTVLLPGPVSTYVGGRFVGYGQAPLVAASESFTLGFGIDTSLRASRELVERSEEIQGGNRVVDLAYRLTIQNFGREEVEVRLMDRMPVASEEVRVTLLDDGERALSDDPDYLREDRRRGILRWDVLVAPGAVGAGAFTQEYTFRLEHDKQMSLSGLPGQGG